jgi:hypothetical protein
MVASRALGLPDLQEVLLFVSGAALAFWLVHLSGRGNSMPHRFG